MKTEIKHLPKSQIEIDFELSIEEFSKYIDRALEYLKTHTKMDGFRPGQVPLKMVEEKVGQENLLMEAGDLAVKESYAKFWNDLPARAGNNLEPIGEPEVQIKKIAKGSPLLFKVKVAVLPEIELPDYKELASKIKSNEISVDEKEVEDALNYLQKSRAKFSQVERPAGNKDFVEIEYSNKDINDGKVINDKFILGEGGFMKDFENNLIGMKQGEEKEFKVPTAKLSRIRDQVGTKFPETEVLFKVKMISVQKMELPPINDEFAKSIGAFDSLVALKNNVKEGISMEKTEGEKHRKRGEILSRISERIKFDLPEKLIAKEENNLFEDFKNQITQSTNISFEEYLKSIKKISKPRGGAWTPASRDLGAEDEFKKSFRQEAEKRLKNFLVLRQIGKAENIKVSNEELEEEMNKFIKNYSRDQLEKVDINRLKEYTKSVLYNEKVFQKLELYSTNN